MFGTAMPKTAVHKDRQPIFAKGEVGFAGQRNLSAPAIYFVPAQETDQNQFCFFVAPTAHKRHHFGSFLFRPDIGHSLIWV